MNMKKIAILALSLCMIAAIAVTGTIAYFSDKDYDKNVMTVGNVDIEQNDEFVQDSPLFPAPSDEYDSLNHVDKVISVTNNGTLPAYVRTIIAFEDNEQGTITAQLHTLWGDTNGNGTLEDPAAKKTTTDNDIEWMQNDNGSWMVYTDKNGTKYTFAVITYPAALASGATSTESLKEIWLDDAATNEFYTAVGATYEIHALSQGVQVGDWTDPVVALDAAFGAVNETNLKTWFDAVIQ